MGDAYIMLTRKIFSEILVSELYCFLLIFKTCFGPTAKKIIIINPELKFFYSKNIMNIIKKIALYNPFNWIYDGIGQLLIISVSVIVRLLINNVFVTNVSNLLEYIGFLFIAIFNNIYKISLRVNFKSIFHFSFLVTKSLCHGNTTFLNTVIINLIKILLKSFYMLKSNKHHEICIVKIISNFKKNFKITNGFTKIYKDIKTFPLSFYYKFPKTIFINFKNDDISSNKRVMRKINYGIESFRNGGEYRKIKKIFLKLSRYHCDLAIMVTFLSDNPIEDLFVRFSKKLKINIIYNLNKKKSSFIFKYLSDYLVCSGLSISQNFFFNLYKVSCFKNFRRTVITLEKIKENKYISILLIGNNLISLENLISVIIEAVNKLKSLLRFPYVIPGGGSVEIYNIITVMKKKKYEKISYLVDILTYSMLKIISLISNGEKWEKNRIIKRLINYHCNNFNFFGYIVGHRKIGNVIKEGIFDILLHKYLIYYTTYEFLNLLLQIDENFMG